MNDIDNDGVNRIKNYNYHNVVYCQGDGKMVLPYPDAMAKVLELVSGATPVKTKGCRASVRNAGMF